MRYLAHVWKTNIRKVPMFDLLYSVPYRSHYGCRKSPSDTKLTKSLLPGRRVCYDTQLGKTWRTNIIMSKGRDKRWLGDGDLHGRSREREERTGQRGWGLVFSLAGASSSQLDGGNSKWKTKCRVVYRPTGRSRRICPSTSVLWSFNVIYPRRTELTFACKWYHKMQQRW